MLIKTERLDLIPLDARRLGLWLEDIEALEKELDCSYRAEPLAGEFLEIVRIQRAITEKDDENYLWHGFWLLLRRQDRVVVGAADFKGPPDIDGTVEIGYGLGKDYEGCGYMTEAVRAMCAWAREQENVSGVVAETEADGLASQRILERCGFREFRREETVWWRL